jgi:two-component sensor histidine kinase
VLRVDRRGKKAEGIISLVQFKRLNHPVALCLLGTAGLATVTFVCYRVEVNLATVCLLYLIVIVLVAVVNGYVTSAVVSSMHASLEEKEALLEEVHHRVKNNLQLISSLLNLQASRVKDRAVAELFADSRNRVRSMAMVHENLYRAGNFARVPMAPHIRNLCGHLVRAYGMLNQQVDLATEVDDVELNMDQAVSCGLIINELVTNALKHAFPGGQAGRIRVELKAADEKRYALAVEDNGIGVGANLDAACADSLGLRLVHDLAEQLQGAIAVDGERGTKITITFNAGPRTRAAR